MSTKSFIAFIIWGAAVSFVTALVGCTTGGMPQIVIHKHDYQAKPPIVKEGYAPRPGAPAPVDYQTVYKDNPFDNPTLIILANCQRRNVPLSVSIDGKERFIIKPDEITANIFLPVGSHQINYYGLVDTVHYGVQKTRTRIREIEIDLERAQYHPICLY